MRSLFAASGFPVRLFSLVSACSIAVQLVACSPEGSAGGDGARTADNDADAVIDHGALGGAAGAAGASDSLAGGAGGVMAGTTAGATASAGAAGATVAAGSAGADAGSAGAAGAAGASVEVPPTPDTPLVESAWCDVGWSATADGQCFRAPTSVAPTGELLIVLHGMSPPGAVHRSTQQMVATLVEKEGVVALFPRGRQGLCSWDASVKDWWCWPTSRAAVDAHAPELLAEWEGSIARIERHLAQPLQRRYLLGFSNGGYLAAYLGLEHWLDLGGVGVVGAGRMIGKDGADATLPPFYIAVGGQELKSTQDAAKNLAYVLSLHGVERQLVVDANRGHSLVPADFTRAWALWH